MTAEHQGIPERRSSPGGNAVTGSLAAAGYDQPPSVALVETARPGPHPFEVVLAQNAWNFLPRTQFRDLLAGYSTSRTALYRARRAVAAWNTRRAVTTVALSQAMAQLMRARGLRPVVAPVTLPLDLCRPDRPSRRPDGVTTPFVLVPGTLTPYKNADLVLDLVRLLPREDRPLVVIAGTDDGSGQRQRLLSRTAAEGIAHRTGPVDREEMTWLLAHARATVVPSRLESLSFSLAEALALSPHVVASPLDVHREVAERLGRQPSWLPTTPDEATARLLLEDRQTPGPVDHGALAAEWDALADLLRERAGR